MTITNYNDAEALQAYLEVHWRWYRTEFEQLCWYLGTRLEIAEASSTSDFLERVQAEWQERATPAVREALSEGVSAFNKRVEERIRLAFREGSLQPNRCPSCRRIVRTPQARQCFWCGHDWHTR
jgi:hypothetical protein